MDTLRFHITRENFCGVSCNQVESKTRAGDVVHSASWSLWQHAGKREGSVSESSEGGTRCSASQVSESVPTYSQGRGMSVPKQGGTDSPPDTGHAGHPLCCCTQPTSCRSPCKRWCWCQQADGLRMATYISCCTDPSHQQDSCLSDPAELPKRSRLAGSPADCSRPNSPGVLLEGSRPASMEDFLQQARERTCSKLWLFPTISLFLCVITMPNSILILT